MIRTTLRSLAARKLRLLLTAIAVVLGVTFVTGTLVLTDTSTRLFDEQFAEATAGVDLVVRDAASFGAAMGVEVDRDPLDEATLRTVRTTEGVAGAHGIVRGSALLVFDGQAVVPDGASVGLSWSPPPYNPFVITTGREPAAAGEVVIDNATATGAGVVVGDAIEVAADDGTHAFRVVGTADFADRPGIPNTTVALFDTATAQRLLDTGSGYSEIQVVGDAPGTELRERLADQLGDEVEITSSSDSAAASAEAARSQLATLRVLLLVLAATALVVGAFVIANTFAIVVAQRRRELATFRALGATGRQVVGAVLLEASILGLTASVVGVASGIGAAVGLRKLAGAFGTVIPDGPLAIEPRTLVTGLLIGTGVTVLAALAPARRAARVAPIEAMRTSTATAASPPRIRAVVGLTALTIGGIGLVTGATSGALGAVGLGSLATLVGTVVVSPFVAGPFAGTAGRLFGGRVPVLLARRNLRRDGRGTAATSVALALGLAVVSVTTVVAASMRAAVRDSVGDVVQAELLVQSARGEMLGGLSPEVHHHVGGIDGVRTVSRLRFGHWSAGDRTEALTAVDPATLAAVADVDVTSGRVEALGSGGILLAENAAERHGVEVGDRLEMTFARTGEQHLDVVGTFATEDAQALSTGYLISLATYAEHFAEDVDATVLIDVAPTVDVDEVRTDVERALEEFPTVEVHDQESAAADRTRMLDEMLGLVTVLLALAILIALLSITNALALAIVERTREFGVLRAIGTTRAQLGRVVRTEALLTAVVGAVTGIVLGSVVAAAVVRSLGTTAELPLRLPVASLAGYLVVSLLGGVAAGVLPARRAARMDVLAAIGSV